PNSGLRGTPVGTAAKALFAKGLSPFLQTSAPPAVKMPQRMRSRRLTWPVASARLISARVLPAPTSSPSRIRDAFGAMYMPLLLNQNDECTTVDRNLQDEVLLRDDVGAYPRYTRQRDVVRVVDGDHRAAGTDRDADVRGKVGGDVRAKGRKIEQILTTRRIGIEIGDDVVAEPRTEHEHIVAGAARHAVGAEATDQSIVAGAAVDPVVANTAIA